MSEELVEATPLLEPHGGTPDLIDTHEELARALRELAAGKGPFAVDAERASGYRYSARAYLIQIKREGGGLHLIDPLPFSAQDFAHLNSLLQSDEVVLHASTQDLPCLRECGLNPTLLFDTELGARIAGLPRVGLGPLAHALLGIGLAKEHSAVDWSQRPLPQEWLTYAALDVEILLELRAKVAELLEKAGKLSWAEQDFAAILKAPPAPAKSDPWRRTSGTHKVKRREQLAIVRELWLARAAIAQELDIAQGRLLSDAAIVELAVSPPISTKKEFEKALRPIGLRSRWSERVDTWIAAIDRARSLRQDELPELRLRGEGVPPIKVWKEKFPERYAPLTHARFAVTELSRELSIPTENLISPELLRRICWQGKELSAAEVEATLVGGGARAWQASLVAPPLAAALREREPLVEITEAEEVITQQ